MGVTLLIRTTKMDYSYLENGDKVRQIQNENTEKLILGPNWLKYGARDRKLLGSVEIKRLIMLMKIACIKMFSIA